MPFIFSNAVYNIYIIIDNDNLYFSLCSFVKRLFSVNVVLDPELTLIILTV